MLMEAAVALGVSPADTLCSAAPYNTETEAFAFTNRFGEAREVILVTSALHMRRALFWFREAGLDPIPAPANHYVKPDPEKSPYNFKPSAGKITLSGKLLHEWVGMGWAQWKRGGREGMRDGPR